jgi:septum site-determining protein MinD
MLKVEDVLELLGIELLGVIPESQSVLTASNMGVPVVMSEKSDAADAYRDVVKRLLGLQSPHRFIEGEKRGFFSRLFGAGEQRAVVGG